MCWSISFDTALPYAQSSMLITDTPPIGRDVNEEFLLSAEVGPFLTGQP